jgi:hypothetical protein
LVRTSPRQFWKEHEAKFPTLARIARDIFSIPATGAGVERLFNSARDVCHYRRGRLNSSTIQDLMMFSHITRFEMEDEQLAFIRSLSIHEEGESDETPQETDSFEPISDTEEDEVDEEVSRLSSVQAGKRRKSVLSDVDESDDDDLVSLMPESQIRASGRVRKRPRVLDDYEVGI